MEVTVKRHHVGNDPELRLSPLQIDLMESPKMVRIASAPTGAGKSYAFQKAMIRGEKILFIVPTRRLADNLIAGLVNSLRRDEKWSEDKIQQKIALWSSDETKRLKQLGEKNITARRVREIEGLNFAMEGGEMIIAIPEVVSYLLLRPFPAAGQSDIGIFHLLRSFDHIVFDEFHTISPRGFGFAGVLARLTACYPETRAKVTFLSATPLDIFPVLKKLGVPESEIAFLEEIIGDEGRVVHGDVILEFSDEKSMADLIERQLPNIMKEIQSGFQVVIIYNRLVDLQSQLSFIEKIFKEYGIEPRSTLLIDSIDDSRIHLEDNGYFATGRKNDPEEFDILIATSSVELGVTFRSNFLIMEPGFEPMNFLQRYGRAARGNHNGKVFIRVDETLKLQKPWFYALINWVKERDGKTISIQEITKVLTSSVQNRFKENKEKDPKHFGLLSGKAEYNAGLYWNLLMNHFSSKKHRWRHLMKYRPDSSRKIYGLMEKVKEMSSDGIFGETAKVWCDRFMDEAKILRDMGETIRVIEDNGNGSAFKVGLLWLQRNTEIMDFHPIFMAEDGSEEIWIKGNLSGQIRKKSQFIQATINACFPHTPYPTVIKDNGDVVRNWIAVFKESHGAESMAWEIYPKAMKAALILTQLTGLVVRDDSGVETKSSVL